MPRLRGQSQNDESQDPCPEDSDAASPRQPFGAAKVRPQLIGLLLALVTLLVYLPAARYAFVIYDDGTYVTENRVVQNGLTWAGVKWAFTTGQGGNWHPVTWLSHMTDCALFGLNAGAHHLVSVLLHTVNAVLLFLLLFRLTNALWPCAFVAALFAWHPLHVESVAWVAERKDVLSTFFALLTLLAYVSYVSRKPGQSSRMYVLCLFLFALGLMSKPMLVTLPFVMLLLDGWPLQRLTRSTWRRLFLEKWPFFALTAASCVVTYIAQRNGEAIITLEHFPLGFRMGNALTAYGRYLLKTVWPMDLAVIYPLSPAIPKSTLMFSAAVLIFLSATVWFGRKRGPYGLVGWLWFLGTLVPVIGLVQVGVAAAADRYTYFPLTGILLAVAFGVRDLASRVRIPRIAVVGAAILALCVSLLLTAKQLHYWRDSEPLFRHALAVTKDNGMAHFNLGVALQTEGRLNEALAEYRAAAQFFPGYAYLHNNLGSVLDDLGRPEEAVAEYRLAMQLKPSLLRSHEGIGIAYVKLGRFAEAMSEFTNAAQLDQAYPWPYFQMGNVLLKQGCDAEAMEMFRAALRIDPDNFQILAQVARVLAADENPAVRDGQTALVYAVRANFLSDSSQSFVLDALGMACAEVSRFDDARTATEKAITLAAAASRQQDVASLQQRLELYRHHQPWRESFAATNTPPKERLGP